MKKTPKAAIYFTASIMLILIAGIVFMVHYLNNRPLEYVAFGDSLAHGYPYHNENKAYSYTDFILKQLNNVEELKNKVSYTNYGISGFTSSDLLTQISNNDVLRKVSKADIITINIGGNDMLRALNKYSLDDYESILGTIDKYADNLVEIFTELRDKNPNAHIYMANLFIPSTKNDNSINQDKARYIVSYINRIITNTSKPYNIKVVQVESIFKGHEFGTPDSWFFDPLHPNQRGYSEMAKPFFTVITQDLQTENFGDKLRDYVQ